VLLLAASGCGGSGSGSTSSATQSANVGPAATSSTATAPAGTTESSAAGSTPAPASPASLTLSSGVFNAGEPIAGGERGIPAHYTCDGADIAPPVSWEGVPRGATELLLLVVDLNVNTHLSVSWAVAGLEPSLHGLPAGVLPTQAILGRNSAGRDSYSICPPKGVPTHFGVLLFALQRGLGLHRGFDPELAYHEAVKQAVAEAQSGFSYQRG
jgi:phosphatidylethanolamine-binding protein (PEBP) family uncharacterized protein